MADSFLVRIDIPKLRLNAAEAGQEMTPDEVKSWLTESGFQQQPGDWWLCESVTAELLDKSEIIEVRRV